MIGSTLTRCHSDHHNQGSLHAFVFLYKKTLQDIRKTGLCECECERACNESSSFTVSSFTKPKGGNLDMYFST